MATASAFGFSGWDPLGSFGELGMSQLGQSISSRRQYKYSKKLMEFQNKLQTDTTRDLWRESLAEGPQRTVAGLRSANLNPLLAVGGMSQTPMSAGSVGLGSASSADFSTDASSAFDASSFAASRQALRRNKVEVDNAEKTGKAIDANIEKTNAETLKTKVQTWLSGLGSALAPLATAYAGFSAKKAVKDLVSHGLTRKSAEGIVKDVAPKATSYSSKNASSVWPVMRGLLPLALGVGTSAYLGSKVIDTDRKIREKFKNDKNFKVRQPNPLFMFH